MVSENKRYTIALAGNPNCGKTTIFNAITGQRRKVGNYPGVTVEKIEGSVMHQGQELDIIDLPGTYSLTAHSIDEVVARNYIIDEKPDVVVNIVDASNIERNLYLTTQILELEVPVVLALNMGDVAKRKGYNIDIEHLSKLLGVPIVETVGHKSEGIDKLLDAAVETAADAKNALKKLRTPNYGPEIEDHVKELAEDFTSLCPGNLRSRWVAVKLLEDDEVTQKRMEEKFPKAADKMLEKASSLRAHIQKICGDEPEIILADRRYGYISGACTEAVQNTVEARHDISDTIDKFAAHPLLGLPIFIGVMYLLFQLTFFVGNPLADMLGQAIDGGLIPFLQNAWPESGGAMGDLRSCVIDGVVAGVGSVFSFVPLIVMMFLGVAFMEDSGYMARAAFVMDRVMHMIGLHGRSFVPMLIGFGCSVPGIMATRTLESKRDRITTMMVLPLMSCGARLPIYMLLLSAFFPEAQKANYLILIYAIGVLLAILVARLFRSTLFKGETTPFVMELPPYRMPTIAGLIHHMWERTWIYVKKAGTILIVAAVIIWAMSTYPKQPGAEEKISNMETQIQKTDKQAKSIETKLASLEKILGITAETKPEAAKKLETPELAKVKKQLAAITAQREEKLSALHNLKADKLKYTVVGRVGSAIEPAIKPMGFDWKIGTALVGAFSAKEVFVTQLGIVYAVGEVDPKDTESQSSQSLQQRLRKDYTPLVGFCICIFCLVSMPCVATFAVTVRESGSWKWGFFQMGYLTVLAWLVTTVIYQVGSLF